MSRRRVLLVQPSINPPGGGNAVACWMIEALKTDHAVTLLTRTDPDLDEANRVFGTTLSAADMRIDVLPIRGAGLMRVAQPLARLALFRDHLLLKRARTMAPDFDVVVTANNESDLGRRGIQYVHFPKFIAARPDLDLRWYQGSMAVGAYQAACAIATGFRPERMRSNVTLVNSAWTGRLLSARHGIDAITLNPPIAGTFPDVPWTERDFAFACVGRIAPEKRIESVIEILEEVRRDHPGLRLRVIGNADDRSYLSRLKATVGAHGSWISLDLDVSRETLVHALTRCRFGIHGMRDEHFGMAVAELARAGTIPFAPNSGGPVDILRDGRLLYDSKSDAVAKILRVVGSDALSSELRESLRSRSDSFSSDRFVRDFRAVVDALSQESAGERRGV